MNIRSIALGTALFLLASSAHAVFFFILPFGAIQNAVQGAHCVPSTAKVGDRINLGGKEWVVKELNGVSSRCNQYPNWPIIAKMEPYVDPSADMQVCLPSGSAAGQFTQGPDGTEIYIRSVEAHGFECKDSSRPVSARAVRAEYGPKPIVTPASAPPRQIEPTPEPTLVPTGDRRTLEPLKASPPTETKSVVERLRELKQLRDENLITDSVYESKQREILSGQ